MARLLARKIVEAGWKTGSHIGREAELLVELNVSRKTFREAVRILERQDILAAETGKHGGLVVKAPALEAVSNIVRNHIELSGSTFREILDAYSIVMHLVLDAAIARMTPARANDLRAARNHPPPSGGTRYDEGLAATEPLWTMGDIAGNPCLAAFAHMLHRLVADFSHQDRLPQAVWQDALAVTRDATNRLVDQLSARDPAAHETLSELHLLTYRNVVMLEGMNSRVWSTQSFLHGAYASAFIGQNRAQKSAIMLSYKLVAAIRLDELPAGTRIGTEAEIMKAHQVSRAVVAEALRMLEFLGIIIVRRGRSAGAEVIDADPGAVIETAKLYLSYYAPLHEHLAAVREGLEKGAINLAVKSLSHRAAEAVLRQVEALQAGAKASRPKLAQAAHAGIIGLSGNPVIALLITVLAQAEQDISPQAPASEAQETAMIEKAAAELRLALASLEGEGLHPSLGRLCDVLAHAASSTAMRTGAQQRSLKQR